MPLVVPKAAGGVHMQFVSTSLVDVDLVQNFEHVSHLGREARGHLNEFAPAVA